MSFTELDIQIRYRSNKHDFPRDFLIPVLKQTVLYKRSVGYFSTSSLLELSTGLFGMAKKNGKIQIICSPKLSLEDIQAIDFGYKTKHEVIVEALNINLTSPLDHFEEERLNLVATMIASGMLEIKLAFMETASGINIYHEKIACYIDDMGNRICYTGSMNETENGLDGNFESIYTFCSWKDKSQQEGALTTEGDFNEMWEDHTEKLKIIPFPKIILDRLLTYKKNSVDYEVDEKEYSYQYYLKKDAKFRVPEGTEMRAYQSEAVASWFKQGCRGIFSMCTGAGKTFTALDCTVELAEKLREKLAIFIVCPFIHLVSQWEEDVFDWGFSPIIAHSKSTTKAWEDRIQRSVRRFKRDGTPFICITTNDTFAGPKIQPLVKKFDSEDAVLFIVDEAHNFGSDSLSVVMPENFKYRIALSATIKRHMDKVGTNKLFSFFGNECIQYGLEQAITDQALVPYDYHPIPVYLEEDELEEYNTISRDLKRYLKKENGKLKLSEAGKFLVFKRTRLLAGARQKVPILMELLEPYKTKTNILVYCGATMVEDEDDGVEMRQIDLVTQKMRNELGMSVQRFTAEEGLNERQHIKHYFQDGQYQVLTAIKCLDEGVNIPGIETAFIMSSSRNPKEFIQRRGRLLRRSPRKDKAVIFDFVTLPRNLHDAMPQDYEADRAILLGELARINEFGRLSLNRGEAEALITDIMEAYDMYIDIDEEVQRMEDYFGD